MANIVCSRCNKLTPRTGNRQKHCPECRQALRRAAGAERERQRRAAQGDLINARSRERYATDPQVRQQAIDYAKAQYRATRSDPGLAEALQRRTAVAQGRYRERTVYGGNRTAALERDAHTCQRCGRKPRVPHIHHIDGRGSLLPAEQQNNDLDNLTTLCVSCHAKVHREREANARAEERI